ncbi:hypothetical protein F5887DRAFT_959153 [Amanita rubescens]|nr:hypothetical protein F5887DRAFT_959153 [Amanita rubescens]
MSHSPFNDFEFAFDPSLSSIFPNPPPLPPSADLFSPAETTDLLGFLDTFGNFNWDHSHNDYSQHPQNNGSAPYSNPHLNIAPDPSARQKRPRAVRHHSTLNADRGRSVSQARSTPSGTSSPVVSSPFPTTAFAEPLVVPSSSSSSASSMHQVHMTGRTKPLLSTPQKRLNHIMSEQKRRNAIRDGYAQLITLLSPAGSAHGINMPTRGRPKGSGSRGKGQSKGKSGVLFRAVEYCRWLEEGRDALRDEVARVEAAAGVRHH